MQNRGEAVTTPAQDAPLVLPAVAFRPVRLAIICVALTAAAFAAAVWRGQPLLGVFFGIGLALGLGNALLVRRSVQSITAGAHPLKSKMALNSAGRLLVISAIGLAIAAVFRYQGGMAVLLGLALFEVLLVATTALPVVKKLRSAAAAGPDGDGTEGTAQ